MQSLLHMNEGANKAEVERQKVIQYYFLDGDNMNELAAIPLGLVPHILEDFGKVGLQLVNQLIGVLPSLLDYTGEADAGKRKRA